MVSKLHDFIFVGKCFIAILSSGSSGLFQRQRLSQGTLGVKYYKILKHWGINTICSK